MKRHYCIYCGKKALEKWMEKVEIAINNRWRWKCKNKCDVERRRYGLKWSDTNEECGY